MPDRFDVDGVHEGDIVFRRYSLSATHGKVTRVEDETCSVKWSKQIGEHDYVWTDEEQLNKEDVIVMATKKRRVS